MYTLLKQDGHARRGTFETVHGTVQTPAFMNVGTSAAIKGGISSTDLVELKCQVELCNTYHLHVRPGDDVIRAMGGLHKFMNWHRPILTDSGGFQVFSLAKLRKIKEEGVTFACHLDGKRIFMGPEESMRIQSNFGSTIAMAFDECIENPAPYDYTERSIARTTRWLVRCKEEMARLNAQPDTLNPRQMLFGINQGSTYADLRVRHMQEIAALGLDGYAIGGGDRAGDVRHDRGGRAAYARGQAPISDGGGHARQHHRGGLPGHRPLRLRDAQPQRAARDAFHLGRHPHPAQ